MAEVLNGHHFLEMDPPWDTQWHAGDHTVGNAAFPEWDTEESSGGYASPSSFTQSSYGAALNHSDHMYSILGQFEPPGPASAQATSQGENANLIQASPSPLLQSPAISVRHSQSPSLPGHPNTNPRSVPLNTSFQFNPQYASVPPAPQLFGTTGMLPSSPTGDPQTHNRFQTMRLPDSRTRSRYEASGAPSETLVGSKRRRSFSDKRPKETRVLESTPPPLELSEDERLLIKLKQEQNMPWKDISREFEERLGRPYQVPALQMRYKRLKERLRLWTDQDVTALRAAYDYWENNKFEIIAQKMLDFGIQDKWPTKLVEKKWEQLQAEREDESAPSSSANLATPFQNLGFEAVRSHSGRSESSMPHGEGLHMGYDPEWTARIIEAGSSGVDPRGEPG